MLTFSFLSDPSQIEIDQITALYRQEGWWSEKVDDSERVAGIIAGSHCFLLALEDGQTVGMGRAISDGTSDAYIQDVTVQKKYRGKGIGTQIIRKLVERLNSDGLEWIGLIAERNSYKFYEKLGFKIMPNSEPMLRTGK